MKINYKKSIQNFILVLLFITSSAQAFEGQCKESLSNSFSISVLKVTNYLNENSLKTLEDFARIRSQKMSKKEVEVYKAEFSKYAMASSFNSFFKELKNVNYWDSKRRLSNASASMVMVLINQLDRPIFSKVDILTIWSLQHINFIDSDNLSIFNFSNNLVKYTGALRNTGRLPISKAHTLVSYLNEECTMTVSQLDSLYSALYESPEDLVIRGNTLFYKKSSLLNNLGFDKNLAPFVKKEFEVKDTRKRLSGSLEFERNNLRSFEAINFYHRIYDINDYLVINKKEGVLFLMNEGREISKHSIDFNKDDRNSLGGAGIYELNQAGYYFDEMGESLGQIEFDFSYYNGMKLYILPTHEEDHNFIIKNHKLNFNALKVRSDYYAYNYSFRDNFYLRTSFKLESGNTEFKEDFLTTLEKEKLNLMRLYQMDSNTYNELALFSYGVLALESKFGESIKYKIKQTLPLVVAIAKGNGIDMSENSSGPSQIKVIPEKIKNFYKIEKSDLDEARYAAVTTLGFSFELLQDLKRISKSHKAINFENIYDYLYYLYQGNRSEITKATATPEKSIKIKMIKKAASKIRVIDHF